MIFSSICANAEVANKVAAAISTPRQTLRTGNDMSTLLKIPRLLRAGFAGTSSARAADFGLTLESAAVEKGLFLSCGVAAEQGVAVGEAAKPADDVGVQLRPFQKVSVAGRRKQRAASLLIGH